MNHLSLYVDAKGRAALHRSGFSALAFLAVPLWALHRRDWATLLLGTPAVVLLHALANETIGLVPGATAQGLLALAWLLAWSIACGLLANRWHRRRLERRGYRRVATEAPA